MFTKALQHLLPGPVQTASAVLAVQAGVYKVDVLPSDKALVDEPEYSASAYSLVWAWHL